MDREMIFIVIIMPNGAHQLSMNTMVYLKLYYQPVIIMLFQRVFLIFCACIMLYACSVYCNERN